jgi:salicylate hydroxylase
MKSQHVVIAGAGIGGLTTGIALAQAGHQVEILEQAPALNAVGAGVTLAPNAMKVLGALGLGEAICEIGVEPRRQRIQHWRDGRILLAIDRGDTARQTYGAPYVYIHRADLHEILIAAFQQAGGRLRLGAPVTGAIALDHGAAALIAGGEPVQGDFVIGADGVKSPIRRLFETAAPHFTGHIVFRAVVPVQGELLRELGDYPGVHIGPGRTAVRYPVHRGEQLNLVFFARESGWAQEGWTIPAQISELHALYGDWAPEVVAMIAALDPQTLFKWAVYARRPLDHWVRDGRIALLGDAAHAMTPFLGQGAACAIEDAMILTRAVNAAASVGDALSRYEAARIARCAFMQQESNDNADRLQGDESHLYGLANLRNEDTLGLFGYDALTEAV